MECTHLLFQFNYTEVVICGILGNYNLDWNFKYIEMFITCTMYVTKINIIRVKL